MPNSSAIPEWKDKAISMILGDDEILSLFEKSDEELEDFAYVTGFYYTTGLTDNKTVLAEKSLRIEYFNIWYNQRFLPVLKMIATAIITIFKKTSEDDIDPDEIDEIDDDNIRSEVISELVSNISEFLKNTSIKSCIGSGLKVQGPPAKIIGSESVRISFRYGISDISSIFKTVG